MAKADIPVGHSDKDGAFLSSIGSFSEEIKNTPEALKRKKRKKLVNAFFMSFIALCAVVLIVCLVLIIKNLSDKERGEEIYNDASQIFDPLAVLADDKNGTEGDEVPESVSERIKRLYEQGEDDPNKNSKVNLSNIRASLSSLKEINPDVVGWIFVENTKINYPLMRSSVGNDDYYLDHAYTGEYVAVGSIYMVSDCDVKLDNNYNTLIYGHNVVNGAMFHDVMKFLNPDFFNTKIYIYTFDGVFVYQPFSIYQTKSDYNYIQTSFGSESEFLAFAAEMKANSSIYSDLSIGSGDTMITLSTCTGTGVVSDARYSLHAKLVEFLD